MTEKEYRDKLKEKQRIVVKIGSSSLTHMETGKINLEKMERLVRVLTDLLNGGREVVLVTSGAVAAGRKTLQIAGVRGSRTGKVDDALPEIICGI